MKFKLFLKYFLFLLFIYFLTMLAIALVNMVSIQDLINPAEFLWYSWVILMINYYGLYILVLYLVMVKFVKKITVWVLMYFSLIILEIYLINQSSFHISEKYLKAYGLDYYNNLFTTFHNSSVILLLWSIPMGLLLNLFYKNYVLPYIKK